ncbi:hypothetical protein ABEU99_28980, partial [Priestia megaterium]
QTTLTQIEDVTLIIKIRKKTFTPSILRVFFCVFSRPPFAIYYSEKAVSFWLRASTLKIP